MIATALPEELANRSIIDLVEDQAAQKPNALALTATSGAGGEIRLTYGQLSWSASKLASGLRTLGIGRGDHVGLMMDNEVGIEASITMLALHHLGAVVVPINARFAPAEIAYVLGKARCSALVVRLGLLPLIDRVRPELPGLKHVVTVGREPPHAGASDWHRIFAEARPPADGWPRPAPDSMSEILFTSGTTAHPKGAVMTHSRSVTAAYGFAQALSLGEADVYQSFFPFFTAATLRCVLLSSWWAGAQAVLDPSLDIEAIISRMEQERTTGIDPLPWTP